MQVNSINSYNPNFGAKIKISKAAKEDLRDAAILSGFGTSLSGTGALSCLPASDPVHHIHSAAKVLDCGFAIGGSATSVGGATSMKLAHSILKDGIKKIKIPS